MKVLIVITTGLSETGGLSTVMLNYYRNITDEDINIDFCSNNEISLDLLNEFKSKNSTYYNLGNRKKKIFSYLKNLNRLLTENDYDVIHVNGNSSTMLFELMISKIRGVKKRIAHVHSSHSDYDKIDKVLRPFFKFTYNYALAASDEAGKWLFKNNFRVLNNAIDLEHYSFNELTRNRLRNELGIKNEKVFGMVGKFTVNKNQTFLLEIFNELLKIDNTFKLLLIGDGPEKDILINKCETMKISESVKFLGLIEDTSDMLSVLDVFIFTSKLEGFGMALLEAQASGLKCFASDTLPRNVKQSKYLEFLSLCASPNEWAQAIIRSNSYDRKIVSIDSHKRINESNLNIKNECHKLIAIYNESL